MHKIFVYGTLKQGGQHHYLLRYAKKYPNLVIAPHINLHAGPLYPYAIRGQGQAIGELYEVNPATLSQLDQLENHPNYYQRQKIRIILTKDHKVMAWIYLNRIAYRYPRIAHGIWSDKKKFTQRRKGDRGAEGSCLRVGR